jgi:hypothetical protein
VDAVTFVESSVCDGSQPAVVANLVCIVPLNVLRSAPYNLKFGDLVVVAVKSRNSFGWSLDSAPLSGGAVILTEP